MNNENLRALSTSEAREIGKKGGKASAKARAERKAMRKFIDAYDRRPLTDEENAELATLGIEKKDRTAKMRRTLALIRKAEDGDVAANKLLLEVSGELTKSALELTTDDPVEGIEIRIIDASGKPDGGFDE